MRGQRGRGTAGLLSVLLAAAVFVFPASVDADEDPAPECTIQRILRLGSEGRQVRCVEKALRSVGYGKFKLDDVFGTATARQVRRYQSDHGLGVTGVMGPQTAQHLGIWGQPLPPDGACARINVVGDSMAYLMGDELEDVAARWDIQLEINAVSGKPTVEMPAMITQLRRQVGDTRCWVIVGGSNDVWWVWVASSGSTSQPCNSSAARRAEAQRRIDTVLDRIRMNPRHQVYWVNVDVRTLPSASCIFNKQLEATPGVEVVDWYSVLQANSDWLLDNVHTTAQGNLRRARLVMHAVR